jgi:NAD(P)H dehydrogenase (quinone)
MQIFLVHVHPEPRSFNAALTRTAVETLLAAGHMVTVSDLHAMNFNPVSDRRNFTTVKNPDFYVQTDEELHATAHSGFAADVEGELRKVESCDLMIWQFPFWWYGVPGMLKGWVDRVFAYGRAYKSGCSHATGVFRGKRALLSLTTGALEASYQKGARNGDLHAMLRPVQRGILSYAGFSVLAPQLSYGLDDATPEQRTALLAAWAERLRKIEQESPIEVGEH